MVSRSKPEMRDPGQENQGKPTMELLAPAGSFPAFEAALAEGADSVYVGAPGFNARALSRDFTFAEIDSMNRQAHRQGVKLYIAMNSLVKESEIPAALEALSCFEQIGPDALIIQDLGLLYLARTWFPGLSLHGSTLMSIHNSLAAQELTSLGFDRVVLARELTIEEIAEVHRNSGAEIEIFIHGAMCFSYSGLCLFSSLHGGKSSLRGQCVQPCRRHYSWLKSGKKGRLRPEKRGSSYLFSMNDLCGVDVLPALRDAGVCCLKIEGRMKSARYVANTVAAYRMALDSMNEPDEEQDRILRAAHKLLDEAMARKRSTGYMLTEKPLEAITPEQTGSSGQLLGRVRGLQQKRTKDGKSRLSMQLTLAVPIKEGDRLRLHDEKTGNRKSFTLRFLQVQGRRQKFARAGQNVELSLDGNLLAVSGRNFSGSLYKVDVGSRIVAERAGHRRSRQLAGRRIFSDKGKVEKILAYLSWNKGGRDRKQPAKGRGKTGGSQSRRRRNSRELPWWVAITNVADCRQRLPVRAARIVVPLNRNNMNSLTTLGNAIKKRKGRIIWRLPPIVHERDQSWYMQQIRKLIPMGYIGFELGHCSQYGFFRFLQKENNKRDVELYASYSLNLLNSASLHGVKHLGYKGALFSLETESENLAAAVVHFKRQGGRRKIQQNMKLGLYVYGRPPLFTSRLDSDHFHYHQPFISPKEEQFTLEHGNGLTLARSSLPFSLLRWRQELTAMSIDYLVLDLTGGPIRQEMTTVSALLTQGGRRQQVLSGNFHGTLV